MPCFVIHIFINRYNVVQRDQSNIILSDNNNQNTLAFQLQDLARQLDNIHRQLQQKSRFQGKLQR
ncbi:hypothetical protein BDF21DRAFT_417011 [Thamnidium elegans]|nr:hypothetical protein BDF21DRAFT_417011 [Thamnidium elegans]